MPNIKEKANAKAYQFYYKKFLNEDSLFSFAVDLLHIFQDNNSLLSSLDVDDSLNLREKFLEFQDLFKNIESGNMLSEMNQEQFRGLMNQLKKFRKLVNTDAEIQNLLIKLESVYSNFSFDDSLNIKHNIDDNFKISTKSYSASDVADYVSDVNNSESINNLEEDSGYNNSAVFSDNDNVNNEGNTLDVENNDVHNTSNADNYENDDYVNVENLNDNTVDNNDNDIDNNSDNDNDNDNDIFTSLCITLNNEKNKLKNVIINAMGIVEEEPGRIVPVLSLSSDVNDDNQHFFTFNNGYLQNYDLNKITNENFKELYWKIIKRDKGNVQYYIKIMREFVAKNPKEKDMLNYKNKKQITKEKYCNLLKKYVKSKIMTKTSNTKVA